MPKVLSDSAAKRVLRRWPTRTRRLWTPDAPGWWLRAQPVDGQTTCPRFRAPGARLFKTQPDGLWLFLQPDDGYADAIVVEVCQSIQNLNDKRSRYMPATHSLIVECPRTWLLAEISVQRGGRQPRWRAAGTFADEPTAPLVLPVRFLRVLYALPNSIYRTWLLEHVPAGYEYFVPHSSLGSYEAPPMQDFLRRLTISSHSYIRPSRA